MVPASGDKISMRARSVHKYVKLTILYGGDREARSVNHSSLSQREMLTASARIQFTIWAKLDAVDRAVMALQNLALLTIDRVHADPFVGETTGNETIL